MITHERTRLIREAWDRCGSRALYHFHSEGGVVWRAEIPRDLSGPVARYEPGAAARVTVDAFLFVHETRRDHPLAPQEWRVVCEGVVLQTGVYR